MTDTPSPLPQPIETWTVAKPAAGGARGVVAAQNVDAAEVGAAVLADGGNAVDAAVATALALTVAEPWMSGLGGGGYALVRDGKTGTVKVVDFGMIAARRLDPADYPVDTGREAADWFGFPAVVEDRNQHGYPSMAVPGSVSGYATLLENFGTRPWSEVIAPAREMARVGHRLTWWTTLSVAADAAWLRHYPGSVDVWLPDGLPPIVTDGGGDVMPLGRLPDTLDRLAEAGPRDFYEGELAAALLKDLTAGGSKIGAEDLADYSAQVIDPLVRRRGGATYNLVPGYTAGPTFAAALDALPDFTGTVPGPETYAAYASTLMAAYRKRLEVMGHAGDVGDRSCTTHLSVVDKDGTIVAMTTTLLSRFGSRVVLPGTGVLMNNGVNWFDPRPGRPNSIKGGARPLSNMTPAIVTRADGSAFAFGASGGRKILPAVFQLCSFAGDFAMDPERALAQPRIDVSLIERIVADTRLTDETRQALLGVAPVDHGEAAAMPARFAIPNGVAVAADGTLLGAAHPFGPLPAAVGV